MKVTRLDNNKSVQVRVNDRGPFISGRIIELSREAASRVDLIQDGATRVKVEVVKEKPSTEAIAEATKPEQPKSFEEPVAKVENKEDKKPAQTTSTTSDKAGNLKINEKPSKTAAAEVTKPEAKPASTSVLVKSQDYTPVGLYEIELKRPKQKGLEYK